MTLHIKELIEKTKGLSNQEFVEYMDALTTIALEEQHLKIVIHENLPENPKSDLEILAQNILQDPIRNDPKFQKARERMKADMNSSRLIL